MQIKFLTMIMRTFFKIMRFSIRNTGNARKYSTKSNWGGINAF